MHLQMHETDTASAGKTNGSALIHTELLVIPQSLTRAQWWNGARCNLECAGSFKEKNKDAAQS